MPRTCDVPGCSTTHYARGFCNRHYLLARQQPDATPAELAEHSRRARTADEVRELLLIRVVITEDGCHEWQGALDRMGYGNVRWNGRLWRAHRLAFHLFVHPVTPGLSVCHSCDNPPCIHRGHLFEGTQTDNMRDAQGKGRLANGSVVTGDVAHYNARLSVADVRAIRADERPQRVIAAQYGITSDHVSDIRRRRCWKHID